MTDDTIKRDLLDQAQPVEETPETSRAKAEAHEDNQKEKGGTVGGYIGLGPAKAFKEVCRLRGLKMYQVLEELCRNEVLRYWSQKDKPKKVVGNIEMTGRTVWLIATGSLTGGQRSFAIAHDRETADAAVADIKRQGDELWKARDRVNGWLRDRLEANKALPPGRFRDEADAKAKAEAEELKTAMTETIPPTFTTEPTVIEVDEILSVREPQED